MLVGSAAEPTSPHFVLDKDNRTWLFVPELRPNLLLRRLRRLIFDRKTRHERVEGRRSRVARKGRRGAKWNCFLKFLCGWSAEILLAWLVGPPRSGPLSAVRPIPFPKPKPTTHKPQGKPPNIKVSIATSAHMCHVRGAYIRPFWRVLVLVLGVFRCFRARGRFEMVRVGENQKEKTNSTLNHSHAVVAPHRDSSTHHTPLHHSKVHPPLSFSFSVRIKSSLFLVSDIIYNLI